MNTLLFIVCLFLGVATLAAEGTGEDLFRAGEYRKAIDAFDKELEQIPGDPEIYNFLGACYYQLGFPAEAEDCYLNSLKLKPDYAFPHLNLALLYLDLGEEEKLWQTGQKLVEYYPDFFFGYLAQAYCLFQKNLLPEAGRKAEEAYCRISRKDPYLRENDRNYLYLLLLELRRKIRRAGSL
ncbi:MAG: tetratricopeptide repeat protein [Candidatus Wallbacteria bacterium]|nr:tetratricopeptide repeat protein [Candidatus Wallbacteria bacterium]